MSSTLRRLVKAEAAVVVAQEAAAKAAPPGWLTEDGLADLYECWHAEGWAAGEADLPRAIAFLRESLVAARAAGEPSFDPPLGWRTFGHPIRVARDWRECQFPAILEAVEWLLEIEYRTREGTPPVTEVEFAELAAWFRSNHERLYGIQQASGRDSLDLGGGWREPVWSGVYRLREGPRAEGAGHAAEMIRWMKIAFPEEQHV
ncbi:MAG: hypothetical protein K8U57_37805 [Planctomycetes bacterium]|nr:hypothetical protein [Planctomycetota bacterium]